MRHRIVWRRTWYVWYGILSPWRFYFFNGHVRIIIALGPLAIYIPRAIAPES